MTLVCLGSAGRQCAAGTALPIVSVAIIKPARCEMLNPCSNKNHLGVSMPQQSRRLPAAAHALARTASLCALIDEQACQYHQTSPILLGPAELSHALLRIMTSQEFKLYMADCQGSIEKVRASTVQFIAAALAQFAVNRGQHFVKQPRSLNTLGDQIIIWGRELYRGRADVKRVRVAMQLALSEELTTNLMARSISHQAPR